MNRFIVSTLLVALMFVGVATTFAQSASTTPEVPVAEPTTPWFCANTSLISVGIKNDIRSTAPGTPMSFTAVVNNKTNNTITNAQLLIKVYKRSGPGTPKDGHNLLDVVMGKEALTLASQATQEVTFEWQVPNNAAAGEYYVTYLLTADDGQVISDGDMTGSRGVFLVVDETKQNNPAQFNLSDTMLNGADVELGSVPTKIDAETVQVKTTITNTTNASKIVPVQWNQYAFYYAEDTNRFTKTEVVTLAPNETKELIYDVQPQREAGVVVTAVTQDGESKSVLFVEYVQSKGQDAYVHLPTLSGSPLAAGVEYSVSSCVHTVAGATDDSTKITLTLSDDDGTLIHQFTKEGVGQDGYGELFTPTKNHNFTTLTVSLERNGVVTQEFTRQYYCNEDCLSDESDEVATFIDFLKQNAMTILLSLTILALLIAIAVYTIRHRKVNIVSGPMSLLFFVLFAGSFMFTPTEAFAQTCTVTGAVPYGNPQDIIDGCASGLGYSQPWDFTSAYVLDDGFGNLTVCHDNIALPSDVCYVAPPAGTGIFAWSGTFYCQGSYPACVPPPPANNAPNAPTITGPTSGNPSVSYTFNFTGTDPDGDTLRYGVDWDNNGTVDQWVPASGHVNSGTQQSANHSWGSNGSYTFQVLTEDLVGARSGWASHAVTITTPLPPSCSYDITSHCINGKCKDSLIVATSFGTGNPDLIDVWDEFRITATVGGVSQLLTTRCDKPTPGFGSCSQSQTHTVNGVPIDVSVIASFAAGSGEMRGEAEVDGCFPSSNTTADLMINNSDGPLSVVKGAALNISWTSANAATCTKFGANWGTGQGVALSGSESVSATVSDTYLINCSGTIDSVVVTVVNQGPNAPTITHPTGSAAYGALTTFTITGTDPDNDQIYYEVDWDNNGTVDATTVTVPSGTAQLANRSWSASGNQTFQARTVDSVGATSSWTTHVINIQLPPPATATLQAQVNGGALSTAPQTITLNPGDSVRLYWSSTNATNCSAAAGTGFSVSGISGDTLVTIPAPNASDVFRVTCTGAGGSGNSGDVTLTTRQRPNFTAPLITYTPSGFNPVTATYASMDVVFQTSNNGGSDTTASANYQFQFDRGSNGYDVNTTGSLGLLAVSASVNRTENVTNVPLGNNRIQVTVDSSDAVAEVSEADNVTTLDIVVPPPNPGLNITADRTQVRSGETVQLSWTVGVPYAMSCRVSGPGITPYSFDPSVNGASSGSPRPSGVISAKSEYLLSCTEPITGTVFTDNVIIEAQGAIEEI